MAEARHHERARASQRPADVARWGSVWIAGDRNQPFKIEGEPVRPRLRRWWQLFGGRL